MSATATGWVWDHGDYRGGKLLVALAVADVVNDLYDNQFWMSTATLARKARVSRSTVTDALADFVANGFLKVVKSGAGKRQPTVYQWVAATPPAASAVSGLVDGGDAGGTSAVSARDMTGERASTRPPSAREPKENSIEPKAVAAAPADPPLSEQGTEPARERDDTDPRTRAREIARSFYDWVKAQTGHAPPEPFMAVAKVVEAALRAEFTVLEVKRGLVAVEKSRPRPLNRQTLWGAMQHRRDRPERRTPTDTTLGMNADWISVADDHAREVRQQVSGSDQDGAR